MNQLKKAIKARDDFIKKNPKLQEYQDEIDGIMAQINNPEGRLEALAQLAEGKIIEFQVAMSELAKICNRITGITKDKPKE